MTEKRFNVFDVDGTIFLEDHEKGSYHIGEIGNVDVNCLNDIADRLNELNDENKELKQFKKSVFALINEKITFVNECGKNHNDIGIPHEYYRGADEILNLLKKELTE